MIYQDTSWRTNMARTATNYPSSISVIFLPAGRACPETPEFLRPPWVTQTQLQPPPRLLVPLRKGAIVDDTPWSTTVIPDQRFSVNS